MDFPDGAEVKTPAILLQGLLVGSLVEELRSQVAKKLGEKKLGQMSIQEGEAPEKKGDGSSRRGCGQASELMQKRECQKTPLESCENWQYSVS